MNVVDLLIVAGLAVAVVEGYRAGFIATVFGLMTWLVGLVLAFAGHRVLGSVLEAGLGLALPVSRAVAFVLILVAAELAFALLGRVGLSRVLRAVRAHRVARALDRVAGIVPSVARALVVIAVSLAALVVLPVPADVRLAIDGSRLGSALVAEVAAFQPRLERLLGTTGEDGLLLVTKLSADEQQQLQLPEGLATAPDPDAERQLFELVNEERLARGLRALELDPRLVPVARAHATEMFQLRYFGHVSPVTGTPFDRLNRAGIAYARAGENLAYAQSVTIAHRGLMDSEGHRENILRPEFTRLGIGVMSAGVYGRMFVQLFLAP